jgi:hypothetical protein
LIAAVACGTLDATDLTIIMNTSEWNWGNGLPSFFLVSTTVIQDELALSVLLLAFQRSPSAAARGIRFQRLFSRLIR